MLNDLDLRPSSRELINQLIEEIEDTISAVGDDFESLPEPIPGLAVSQFKLRAFVKLLKAV